MNCWIRQCKRDGGSCNFSHPLGWIPCSPVFPLIPFLPFFFWACWAKKNQTDLSSQKGLCKYSDLYSSLFSLCWRFQFKTVFSWKAVKSTWRWHRSRSSYNMLASVLFRMQKKGLFSQIIWFPAKYFYTFSAKKGSQWSNSSIWHYSYT